uniref:Uncharacterized protein n=1 Tax=Rhizophora mucronata TaxID=61149 RepID=A0A2P2PS11_RHIMU
MVWEWHRVKQRNKTE